MGVGSTELLVSRLCISHPVLSIRQRVLGLGLLTAGNGHVVSGSCHLVSVVCYQVMGGVVFLFCGFGDEKGGGCAPPPWDNSDGLVKSCLPSVL